MSRAIIHQEYLDAVRVLSKREQAMAILAVTEYLLEGVEPEGLSEKATAIFNLIRKKADHRGKQNERVKKHNTNVNSDVNNNVNSSVNTNVNINVKKEKEKKSPLVPSPPVTPLSLNTPLKEKENIARTRARKIPPSLEDVKAYCEERKNGVNAARFCDFYASKGWMVGKNRMVDWQAAVRQWEQREQHDKPKSSPLRDPAPNKYDEMRKINQETLLRLAGEG